MVLVYLYLDYVLQNISSLFRNRRLAEPDVTPLENFFLDLVIFLFFVSSIALTIYQILNYVYPKLVKSDSPAPTSNSSPFEIVSHISTEEEVKVLNAILDLSPRAYKFEISRKTGLSRMKVHRILQRLEQRDIVEIEKVGRNSRVKLASWLIPSENA